MMELEAESDPSAAAASIVQTFSAEAGVLRRTWNWGGGVSSTVVPSEPSGHGGLADWWRAYLDDEVPKRTDESRGLLRSAELFSGSGGLGLGLRQSALELGYDSEAVAAIDHDGEALAVFDRNHHTEIAKRGSVADLVDYKVRGSEEDARFRYEPEIVDADWGGLVGSIDVLLAGPPCQGHSNLNNHTRRSDVRNDLFLTVPAMAVALRAPIVVVENVPAVVHDHAGVTETAQALFESAGYAVESGVLKADKLGWPQTRNRYFMVARLDRRPLPIERVAALLAHDPLSALWALDPLERFDPDSHMCRAPVLSEENVSRIDWLFDNDRYDLALSERPECHQDGTTYPSVYGRMKPDEPAQTITTGFMTPGRGRYIHPTQRRVLRPLEAARLQGFPTSYKFEPEPGLVPSSMKLAKWIGDAVPMPLGHAASMAALLPGPIDLN